MLSIKDFRINHTSSCCLSDNCRPVFCFALSSSEPDSVLAKATINMNGWSVETDSQVDILYRGKPLKPFTKYTVTLTVVDSLGETATTSSVYETGYLGSDFSGKWISDSSYVFREAKISPKPMIFRKHLSFTKPVKSVKVYSTAMGIYDFLLNGEKVGKNYFAPGFTSYAHQLMYQCYDITSMLQENNELCFELAGGWAVGSFVFTRANRISADRQALLADIRIEYEDGETEVIGTDDTWEVSTDSPILMADFYDGETYDARIALENISFHNASNERIRQNPVLIADYGAPVIAHEVFEPKTITTIGDGKTIIDFGQNFAGVVSFKVKNANEGQEIVIKHAEILKEDGDLNTLFLRSAKATITYICKEGEQEFSPTLTYMGFRYISIEGINPADIEVKAIAIYSDIEEIGSFECSNPLINRLQENIKWSSKSNFVDIPTDCPQRDERMGWTGDIAVFAKTAYFNFDMSRFIDKWLLDLRSEQLKTGGIPNTVPVQGYGFPATMPKMAIDFWGDAALMVPYADYMATGNKSLLEKSYESMKKYVNACKFWASFGFGQSRYIWHTPSIFHFGDWIAPDVPKMSQWQGRSKWTATASLKNTSSILSEVAEILGKDEDKSFYRGYSNKVKDAYINKFTNGEGKLKEEFQTGYVLPLHFRMFSSKNQAKAAQNLAELVKKNDYCIGTGFPGTPFILFALADNGQKDTAFAMLENTKCPSWLYEVRTGGTTVWERWNGLDENGKCTINDDGTGSVPMISYNHYASGAVGDFLYSRVAGIEPIEPGYKRFKIQPIVGGTLTYAKASTRSPYGTISSSWKLDGVKFTLEVEVPYGSTAEVIMPSGHKNVVTFGKHRFSE